MEAGPSRISSYGEQPSIINFNSPNSSTEIYNVLGEQNSQGVQETVRSLENVFGGLGLKRKAEGRGINTYQSPTKKKKRANEARQRCEGRVEERELQG